MITQGLVNYCQAFHPKIKDLLTDGVIKHYEVKELIARAYSRDLRKHRSVSVDIRDTQVSGKAEAFPPYKEKKYIQLSLEL